VLHIVLFILFDVNKLLTHLLNDCTNLSLPTNSVTSEIVQWTHDTIEEHNGDSTEGAGRPGHDLKLYSHRVMSGTLP